MLDYNRVKGVSFLEIIIALLLSAVILAEVFKYTYFLERSIDYAASQVESIEKNNVLFAWMVNDIEMAGYIGCVNAHSREIIIDSGHYLQSAWLDIDHSQLLSQYMSTEQFAAVEKTSSGDIVIDHGEGLKVDDVVFIENCWEAEVNKIKKISSINYGAQRRLQFYSPIKISNIESAYVAKLVRHQYFIKNTGLYVINEKNDSNQVLENMYSLSVEKSHGRFMITVIDGENNLPLTLMASSHNAN